MKVCIVLYTKTFQGVSNNFPQEETIKQPVLATKNSNDENSNFSFDRFRYDDGAKSNTFNNTIYSKSQVGNNSASKNWQNSNPLPQTSFSQPKINVQESQANINWQQNSNVGAPAEAKAQKFQIIRDAERNKVPSPNIFQQQASSNKSNQNKTNNDLANNNWQNFNSLKPGKINFF